MAALTAPVGGETVVPCSLLPISWSYSGQCAPLSHLVEYSTDGGASWNFILTGAGGGGLFNWLVSPGPTPQARVRVMVTNASGTASDESGDFTIVSAPPVVTLTAPAGGETVCAGSVLPITWSHSGPCPPLSHLVEYSTDGGASWNPIASGVGSSGLINWTVPSASTSLARVRVTLTNGPEAASDESTDLTLIPGPDAELSVPDGGESWGVGSTHDIVWDNLACDESTYSISFSTNGGVSWMPVFSGSGPSAGSYSWVVPPPATTQGRIRVSLDGLVTSDVDVSDADFTTFATPATALLSPAPGDVWVEGTTHGIGWTNSGGPVGSYSLDYSTDAGSSWTPIASGAGDGGGAYLWTAPSLPGASVRVRVTLDNDAGSSSVQGPDIAVVALAPFVDVTSSALTDAGNGRGVAWVDAEGDGDQDLVVSRGIAGRTLYRSDGFGSFAASQPAALAAVGFDGYATVWGDVDGDGDEDAYLVNSGANALVRNDGGLFTDVSAPPLDDSGAGRGAAWGDYDLDGDLDLYVVNLFSSCALLRNDGAGLFADVTVPPLADAGASNSAEFVDVDSDGDVDLYVVAYGPNRWFRNDGGVFVDATADPLGDASTGSGASWGDYDDDGDPDVFLANLGGSKLLRNDGGGMFADVTAPPLDTAGLATGAGWEDADSDGDLDLYVANQSGADHYFRNDGAAFADATVPPLDDAGSGQAVAWGDADGNGSPDLFLVNSGASSKLFLNFSGGANRWIDVRLVGTQSNVSAIGARVRVTAGGVSRFRSVTSGSGYLSQGSRVLHFGLGAVGVVDEVEVLWPSGILQEVVGPPADTLLVIVEAVATGVAASRPPAEFRLSPAVPNPFRSATVISFALPRAEDVSLRVVDVAGRLVRTLVTDRLQAGWHERTWNGRDDRGAPVSSGVYFCRLESGVFRETDRVVKLR
jgi:hypothetical protein